MNTDEDMWAGCHGDLDTVEIKFAQFRCCWQLASKRSQQDKKWAISWNIFIPELSKAFSHKSWGIFKFLTLHLSYLSLIFYQSAIYPLLAFLVICVLTSETWILFFCNFFSAFIFRITFLSWNVGKNSLILLLFSYSLKFLHLIFQDISKIVSRYISYIFVYGVRFGFKCIFILNNQVTLSFID